MLMQSSGPLTLIESTLWESEQKREHKNQGISILHPVECIRVKGRGFHATDNDRDHSDIQLCNTSITLHLTLIPSSSNSINIICFKTYFRHAFVGVDGIATIVSVLSGRVNFQIQYQLTFCLWVRDKNEIFRI